MKKFFYIMPAVLICMLYALLVMLAGGIGGLQPIVLIYVGFPLISGILMRKNKWWGCFFGIAMGGLFLFNGLSAQPRQMLAVIAGALLAAYYLIMGIICLVSGRKQ